MKIWQNRELIMVGSMVLKGMIRKGEHPCLVPYEDLSDEKKEYDRITSMETLKFIKKLWYKIKK